MFVDIAAAAGLKLPPLSDASVERLRSTLPSYHIPANPLDTTGSGAIDRQVFRTCLEALCDDTEIGIVGVMQDIRADHWVLLQAAEVSAEVARGSRKPIVFFSNTTRHVDPQIDSVLAASGVPVLYGTSEVVTAISAALSVGLPREEPSVTPPKAGQKAKCAASAALASGWASELLTFAGVESVPSRLVSTSTEAHAAARSLGFPLVLKAIGAGLEHKSEAGAVRLGIADETELANALDDFSRIVPSAEGLLVQRMIEGAVAELIVGIQRDPVYGWTVVVGAGGTLAELLDDVVVRIAPVSETEARQMLSELRQFRLLDGFRGRPRGDIEAAAAAVSGISRLAPQLEGVLSAFEINPLTVLPCGGGAVALDTLAIAAGEMR
jgi:acyl-CoA synthetase (NDP forming)